MRSPRTRRTCLTMLVVAVLGLALAVPDDVAADLNNGLVAYWSFDDGTAHDDSGNGHDGTIYGANATGGMSGLALEFDGIDDYVNTWTDFSWTPSDSFSLCLWIRLLPSSTPQGIFGKGEAGGYGDANWEWNFDLNENGGLRFIYYCGGHVGIRLQESALLYSQWYHVLVTYEPVAKARLYVNGALADTYTDIDSPWIDRSTPVLIGHSYFSQYLNYFFEGTIDEVRIYDRALSEDEILDLYWSMFPDPQDDTTDGDKSDVSGTSSDPVNTATGSFFHQETDLSIPSRGSPLTFTRFYNSKAAAPGRKAAKSKQAPPKRKTATSQPENTKDGERSTADAEKHDESPSGKYQEQAAGSSQAQPETKEQSK